MTKEGMNMLIPILFLIVSTAIVGMSADKLEHKIKMRKYKKSKKT